MKRCQSKVLLDENEEGECVSVLVREPHLQEILSLAFESLLAGQLGRTKHERIASDYYWSGMYRDTSVSERDMYVRWRGNQISLFHQPFQLQGRHFQRF